MTDEIRLHPALYLVFLVVIALYFSGCAPKDQEPACGEPNQYQCVNTCDGLYVRRQSNWNRYYADELSCSVDRDMIYEEYDNEIR